MKPVTQTTGAPETAMKDGIHPKYVACKVTCGCGSTFETRATVPELRIEVCSVCHPFYTGKQRLVDTAGRVERFKTRYAAKG
jgi:large subunit ribosomal protein L31